MTLGERARGGVCNANGLLFIKDPWGGDLAIFVATYRQIAGAVCGKTT
jgi:hypothetical protein